MLIFALVQPSVVKIYKKTRWKSGKIVEFVYLKILQYQNKNKKNIPWFTRPRTSRQRARQTNSQLGKQELVKHSSNEALSPHAHQKSLFSWVVQNSFAICGRVPASKRTMGINWEMAV